MKEILIESEENKKWKDSLFDVKYIFEKHKINYWLDEGTLVGALRSGTFIPWDNDIDLAILEEEKPKIIKSFNELKTKNFFVRHQKEKNHISFYRNDTKIDINIYIDSDIYNTNNNKSKIITLTRWWNRRSIIGRALDKTMEVCHRFPIVAKILFPLYVLFADPETIAIEKNIMTEFQKIKFLGKTFKVPKRATEYLRFRFGSDWKVPKHKGKIVEEWNGVKYGKNKYISS